MLDRVTAAHSLPTVDVAVVCALREELEAVLQLLGGAAAWRPGHIDNFTHYYGRFVFPQRELTVVACHLFEMGATATAAQVMRLQNLRPRLVIMVGICAGWEDKGINLGDVVVATGAFDSGRGKQIDDRFLADLRTYEPPPWLKQKIDAFIPSTAWADTIATPRPLSLRYQAEWLLCRLAAQRLCRPSDEDWDEIKRLGIDVPRAKAALRDKGLIDADAAYTAAADAYLDVVREHSYGQLVARPEPVRPRAHSGVVASGSAVVAVPDPFTELGRRVRTVRALDMEIAAFYSTVRQLDPHRVTPAFAVKGVSDYATMEKDDSFHAYASEAAARWVYAFLERELTPAWDELFPTERQTAPERPDFLPNALPAHYIERTDLLVRARTALFGESRAVALTALHGMGGIGKSVLARALCEDSQVQSNFPDGILWCTLGQAPDLTQLLRTLVEHLRGVVRENVPTVAGLSAELGNLLRARRCLLVLDDLWQRGHAEPLLVGGPGCRVLLTTRDAEVARAIGAQIQRVDLLREDDAIQLLEHWAEGHLDVAEGTLKREIIGELGRLPLAIRLAGSQLRRWPPTRWLKEFRERRMRLREQRPKGHAHDDLETALALSIEALGAEARQRYLRLAIFKEDEPIPLVAATRLWFGPPDGDDIEADLLLQDLAARALIDYDPATQRAGVHDLLRDLIFEQLSVVDREAAHKALLAAYCPPSGLWHEAQDDGYLFGHLVYHLVEGEAQDQATELVTSVTERSGRYTQPWSDARYAADGSYVGYLADIDVVWLQADAACDLALGMRCALIAASIRSLSSNIPPALLVALVTRGTSEGCWTPAAALEHVRQMSSSDRQAEAIIALSTTAILQQCPELALRVTCEVSNVHHCAQVLQALAPHLPSELLAEALAAARAIAHELSITHKYVDGVATPSRKGLWIVHDAANQGPSSALVWAKRRHSTLT
jgi:nucleoside phosphorylase